MLEDFLKCEIEKHLMKTNLIKYAAGIIKQLEFIEGINKHIIMKKHI
jgi:hypothetical protein